MTIIRDEKFDIVIISEYGDVTHHKKTEDEIKDMGYISPARTDSSVTGIYIEGFANPIKEFDWKPDEEIEWGEPGFGEGTVANFVPTKRWKTFRDIDAVQQAFNHKRDILGDIDWKMIVVIVALIAVTVLAYTALGGI